MCKQLTITLGFAMATLLSLSALAADMHTTYQAKIIKPDGTPLESTNVNFRFTILDPLGSCILYTENFNTINMAGSGGLVYFSLGSGIKTFPTSGTVSFSDVFNNQAGALSCEVGGPPSYTPAINDLRKIVMQFHDGTGWQTLPAMTINHVPYAMYAAETNRLNGKTDLDFVQVTSIPTCSASQALQFNGASFNCVAVGSGGGGGGTVVSVSGTAPIMITGSASAPVISISVASLSSDGYLTAADYAEFKTVSATANNALVKSSNLSDLTNAATARTNLGLGSFATVNSLTASDVTTALGYTPQASGSITSQWTTSGTTINYSSGNVGIGTTAPITRLDISGGVRISMESATCAVSYAGTLRYNGGSVEYCNGSTWAAFGVSGAGLQSLNGSTSGIQTFANGTAGNAPAFSTVGGVHTLNIPLASATGSVTAGLIANSDYVNFSNKMNATSSAVIAALGYTPVGYSSTSGTQNITFAASAGASLAAGAIDNILMGRNAGRAITSGDENIILGRNAGFSNQSGFANLFMGSYSGYTNMGDENTFVGAYSGGAQAAASGTGYSNAVLGAYAGARLTNGYQNTMLGYRAGQKTTTGFRNFFGGYEAGLETTEGYNNVFIGYSSGLNNTTANKGVALGADTLTWFVPPDYTDSYNTAIGAGALYGVPGQSTGIQNTALGGNAGFSLTTGSNNILIGYNVDAPTPMTNNFINIGNTIYGHSATGNVGLGTTTPTAKLHLAAGTTSTAPFKFTSGTLLTSPQSGTMEYDGANFYVTDGSGQRRAISTGSSSGTVDNASNINSTGNIVMNPNGGTNSVIVSSTVASTSSNTGALVVNGGLGIAGNIYSSGNIVTSSNIQGVSVTATSGMISPYIAGSVNSAGNLTLDSTTHATKGNILLAPNGGNVGIGTTSPNANLDIVKSGGTGFYTGVATNITSTSGNATGFDTIVNGANYATGVLVDTQSALAAVGVDVYASVTTSGGSWVRGLNVGINDNSVAGTGLRLYAGGASTNPSKAIHISSGYNAGYAIYADTNGKSYFKGSVGIGTLTPEFKLSLKDDGGIIAEGTYGSGATLVTSGTGARMFWYPRKAAFRAGLANGDEWDDINVGNSSAAFGEENYATGNYSFSAGNFNESLGVGSFTAGWGNNAIGPDSFAIGEGSTANSMASIAMGTGVTASAARAIAMGESTIASGEKSMTAGYFTTAPSLNQFTIGRYNMPKGSENAVSWIATDPLFVIGNGTGAGTSRSNAMMVLKNGYTGFGVTTPVTRLDVSGGVRISMESATCAVSFAGTLRYNSGNIEYCNGTTWSSFAASGSVVSSQWTTSGTTINYMGSNVGIGTTSPARLLHVNGPIKIQPTALPGSPAAGDLAVDSGASNTLKFYNGSSWVNAGGANSINELSDAMTDYVTNDSMFLGQGSGVAGPGFGNMGFGKNALNAADADTLQNLAIGIESLVALSSGDNNTSVGLYSQWSNVDGYDNVSLGEDTLAYNVNGFGNVAIGNNAGRGAAANNYSGNVLIGHDAGRTITTGSNNIMIGWSAGNNLTSGSKNIVIGHDIDVPVATANNQMTIGNLIYATGLNAIGTTVATGNVGIASSTPGSRLVVKGTGLTSGTSALSVTNSSNVVSFMVRDDGNVGIGTTLPGYTLDVSGTVNIASGSALRFSGTQICSIAGCTSTSDQRLKENIAPLDFSLEKILALQGVQYDWKNKNTYGGKHQIGFIAQDLEKIFPEVVYTDKETSLKTVSYGHLIAPLVEAFKAMFNRSEQQQREIATLKEQMNQKDEEIIKLKDYLCGKDPAAPICVQGLVGK